MKKLIKKYRGIVIVLAALVFNLIASLLVWHPEGQKLNIRPMTITEWIFDIISLTVCLFGFVTICYDVNANYKDRIKEAINEAIEEQE